MRIVYVGVVGSMLYITVVQCVLFAVCVVSIKRQVVTFCGYSHSIYKEAPSQKLQS